MSLSNDIDLQFRRCKYGWSEAILYVDNSVYNFILTHVFNEPLEALLSAAVSLVKGIDEVYFIWYKEPGEYHWKFTKVKSDGYLLDVSIYEYPDIVECRRNRTNKLNQEKIFKIARNFWIDIIISEAEKIAKLLSYPNYKIALLFTKWQKVELQFV